MCTCSMHCCCPPVSGMLQALADRTDTVLDGLVAETDQVSGALADAADTSLGIVADATETYLAVPPTLATVHPGQAEGIAPILDRFSKYLDHMHIDSLGLQQRNICNQKGYPALFP